MEVIQRGRAALRPALLPPLGAVPDSEAEYETRPFTHPYTHTHFLAILSFSYRLNAMVWLLPATDIKALGSSRARA